MSSIASFPVACNGAERTPRKNKRRHHCAVTLGGHMMAPKLHTVPTTCVRQDWETNVSPAREEHPQCTRAVLSANEISASNKPDRLVLPEPEGHADKDGVDNLTRQKGGRRKVGSRTSHPFPCHSPGRVRDSPPRNARRPGFKIASIN